MSLVNVVDELSAALKAVPGVRFTGYGDNVDPPALLMSPPSLTWDGYFEAPSEATVQVFLVVPADDRAVPRLLSNVQSVADAINTVEDASVTSANPTVFLAGNTELPAYVFNVAVTP